MKKEKFTIPGTKITFEVDDYLVLPLLFVSAVLFSLLITALGLAPLVLTVVACYVIYNILKTVKFGGDDE